MSVACSSLFAPRFDKLLRCTMVFVALALTACWSGGTFVGTFATFHSSYSKGN